MSRKNVPVSVRIPARLHQLLLERAAGEDLSLSQLARRALRREVLEAAGLVPLPSTNGSNHQNGKTP